MFKSLKTNKKKTLKNISAVEKILGMCEKEKAGTFTGSRAVC